jgi:hypothetical protein
MALDLPELVVSASVRAAVGVDQNSTLLPDDFINQSIFVNPAIRTLKSYYADVEEVTDDEEEALVIDALNLLVAANLLPSVPMLSQQRTATGSGYTRQLQSVEERQAALRQQAQTAIAGLAALSELHDAPTMFDLACGRRGR